MGTRERRTLLKNIVEVNRASARNQVGFRLHIFPSQRLGKFGGRARKQLQVDLEEKEKIKMSRPGGDALKRNPFHCAQMLRQPIAKTNPGRQKLLQAIELRQSHRALHFRHLVIRRKKEWVSDSF